MLIHQLTKELAGLGVHSTVLTTRAYRFFPAPLAQKEEIDGVTVERIGILPQVTKLCFLPTLKGFRDIVAALKKGSPDIVHVYGSFPNLFTFPIFFLCKLLKKKIVMSPIYNPRRVTLARGSRRLLLHFFDSKLLPRLVRQSDVVFSLTDEEARWFGDRGARNIVIVPEATKTIDVPNSYVEKVLEKFGLRGKKIALSVGRIERRKGFDLLVEAWATVEKRIPDSRLVIVGAAVGDLQRVMRIVREKNLRTVVVTGELCQADLHSLYRAADVVVSASRFETFVRVALEAWSYRKPYVGFDLGAATSHIVEGTALLVAPYDLSALSRALCMLLCHPELCSRIGEKGFAEYQEKYSWRRNVNRIRSIYASTVSEKERPSWASTAWLNLLSSFEGNTS